MSYHFSKNLPLSVSAIDPVASMMGIQNDDLGGIANEVRTKMQSVIDAL